MADPEEPLEGQTGLLLAEECTPLAETLPCCLQEEAGADFEGVEGPCLPLEEHNGGFEGEEGESGL